VEHRTGIPHSPTGQAVVERAHRLLKEVLQHQKGSQYTETPTHRLAKALFTINFLNTTFEDHNPRVVKHFNENYKVKFQQRPEVLIKDPHSAETQGPFP
ncbi:IGEB protein, partial [Oriolus oriolus]|nr:IGEB protein [Oriolus oriolus]